MLRDAADNRLHDAVQGAPKAEGWAGWESAAPKEEKAAASHDDWGKW